MRETETERDRERERQRQRDRQTDRQSETERHTGRGRKWMDEIVFSGAVGKILRRQFRALDSA